MNSIEVTNSPPIKDENYEKTASLLKVIAASQTPNDSGEDKHTIVRALYMFSQLKFIYSEEATKFCEIFPLFLTTVHTVKSKGKISQNFVAFSENMNFIEKL